MGFILGGFLSFTVGANDCANSFGTAIGSNVMTFRTACILGAVCETAGAVFLSGNTIHTVLKIVDMSLYKQNMTDVNFDDEGEYYDSTLDGHTTELFVGETMLMLVAVSTIVGSSTWQFVATKYGLPVSATHSGVAGLIGATVTAKGLIGVKSWTKLVKIVAAWFISPVMAGIFTCMLYMPIRKHIVMHRNPLRYGIMAFPVLFAATLAFNVGAILTTCTKFSDLLCTWTRDKYCLSYTSIDKDYDSFVHKMSNNETHISPDSCQICKTEAFPDSFPLEHSLLTDPSVFLWGMGALIGLIGYPLIFIGFRTAMKIFNKGSGNLPEEYVDNIDDVDETEIGLVTIASKTEIAELDQMVIEASLHDLQEGESKGEMTGRQLRAKSFSAINRPANMDADEDSPFTRRLFIYLQWMSAVTGSLAHGGNDVGNAIGCLVMIFIVYDSPLSFDKSTTEIPQWLLFYGGCGITAGLCLFGRRVIETMGKSLTRLTPSRAYCVEIMAAVTVMLALQVGIPVSTTHCKTGAIISIGLLREGRKGVDLKLAGKIFMGWVITLPVAAAVSATLYKILEFFVI